MPVAIEQMDALPTVVQRYFYFALADGQFSIRQARVSQDGEFRFAADGGWFPFHATEYFTVDPPQFVWDASIHTRPLMSIRVRDMEIAGQARMEARLFGLFPVASALGKPELATASLQRYLAELAWLPTALLPGHGVDWVALDEDTARATMHANGTSVIANFRFGPTGEILQVSADRFREVDGALVLTPWTGRFHKYQRMRGLMIPMVGEAEWVLPTGPFPYWRGRITNVTYDY